MDKNELKKLGAILARLELELGGNIPEEYLFDGLCKELGLLDEETMKKIKAEAEKLKDEKRKTK